MADKRTHNRRKILTTDKVVGQLKGELKTQNQTVWNALNFNTYSPLAKKIRARAITLMQETIKHNASVMAEFEEK